MLSDYTKRLRTDKRLMSRKGWISDEERENLISSLEDASEKAAPPEEEESEVPETASATEFQETAVQETGTTSIPEPQESASSEGSDPVNG